MVIDGNSAPASPIAIAKFERDRIRIPADFVEAARLSGEVPIQFWLLVISPGRYRLLKRTIPTGTGDVQRVVSLIDEVKEPGGELDGTDNNTEAAVVGRLIPCVASPRGPGWRIDIPKVIKKLTSEKEAPSFVFLLIVAGFVELWFPDTLREAMSVPISQLMS
jgi:hypothetical protein